MTIPQLATPERPLPVEDLDIAPFWEGVRNRKLLLQRCPECQAYRHPPMAMCPECNAFNNEWVESSGRGTVYSWIIVRHSVHPYFMKLPYNVVLIELEEGIRLFSNLLDVEPDEIQEGMLVQVDFIEDEEGTRLFQFRPR